MRLSDEFIVAAVLAFCCLLPAVLHAQVIIDRVSGEALTRAGQSEAWEALHRGHILAPADVVRTGDDGVAELRYPSGATVTVRPRSLVLAQEGNRPVVVTLGTARFRVPRGMVFEVQTTVAVAAVRGTDFGMKVDETTRTTVYVFDGEVGVTNKAFPKDEVQVHAGEKTVVEPMRLPAPPTSFESGEFGGSGNLGLLERSEDPLVEITQQPVVERYLAFTDPQFDALRNPAYLTGFYRPRSLSLITTGAYRSLEEETEVSGLPSGVQRHEQLGGDVLFQQMVAVPMGHSGVVGFFLQGMGTSERVSTTGTDFSLSRIRTTMNNLEGRMIASKKVGRHTVGLSGMGYRSDQHLRPAGGDTVDTSNRVGAIDIGTLLSVGTERTVGIGAQHLRLKTTGGSFTTSKDAHGWITHVDVLYRQPIGAHLLGVLGQVERTVQREVVNEQGGQGFRERFWANSIRGGIGMGFFPSPTAVVVTDLAGGVNVERAVYRDLTTSQVKQDERDLRLSGSLHVGAELRPMVSRPWVITMDVLHVFERLKNDFTFMPGANETKKTALTIHYTTTASAGVGYLYRGMFFEYMLTVAGRMTDRPPTHQLLVRHTY